MLHDFARSFELADLVVVPDIYFVRDSQQERAAVSAADLVELVRENGKDAFYCDSFERIVELVKCDAREGDVVVTMGAGDIWKVADEFVRWLG
jgi:UDP-N-acetylmuramate--alanine ligase